MAVGTGETNDRPLKVLVVSASMGAGHTGIAAELIRQLSQRGHQSQVVDYIDALPGGYGRAMRSIYRSQLRYAPWTYDAMYRLRFRYPYLWGEVNAWYRLLSGRRLLKWVADAEADVVVSLYPLASAVLGELRQRQRLQVPVLTYITDLGVHPLWVSGGVDLHLAVHPQAVWQAARRAGGPACSCAPLVGRAFLDPIGRDEARARLGLDPVERFALVVAGAWGVGHIEQTVEAVAAAGFHPITVCGNHAGLKRRLSALGQGTVLGWTDEMPTWMAAANVLVENAGGLSCMEAFAAGLPVVTYCPIAGHGRHNAEEMERAGLTTWARTPEDFDAVLRRLGDGDVTGGRSARCLFGTQQAATVIEELCAGAARAGRPGTTDTPVASDPAGGRKVVVSGRAATIGADLVDCLVAVGDQVTIVDHTAPGRPDLTYWAVPSAEVDGLVMATAGAEEVYHVTGPAIDDGEAERVREACRRNGVQYTVVTIGTHAEPERTDAIEPQIAEPALAYAARSERGSRGETLSGALAGASLAVVLLAGLIPASGTPLISRLLAEGAGILAAGVAWSRGRRSALPIPAVVAAGGALAALWLLLQSTGGLPTLVSGLLFGFFVGVPLARLRLGRGPLPRQAALVATGIILAVAAVAHPAMSWLDAALVVGGPFAILLGRPMPDWSMKRRQLWEVASGAVAVTAVLATWVGANSAGANVADHGSRRSPDVAITFDGITDPATLQRLVATLDGSGTRATFFVPAPMLQTTAQVGTLLLKGHQQLANGADAPRLGSLARSQLQPAEPRPAGVRPQSRRLPHLLSLNRRPDPSDDGRRRPPPSHDHGELGRPSQRTGGLGPTGPPGVGPRTVRLHHRPAPRYRSSGQGHDRQGHGRLDRRRRRAGHPARTSGTRPTAGAARSAPTSRPLHEPLLAASPCDG